MKISFRFLVGVGIAGALVAPWHGAHAASPPFTFSLLKNVNPNTYDGYPAGSAAKDFVEVNGKVVFIARDGTNGSALWATNGTGAGTTMLVSGGLRGHESNVLTSIGNNVLFERFVVGTGYQLWRTNGTGAGTAVVKPSDPNICPCGESISVNGKAYFGGSGDGKGSELWVSDGTDAGTHIVKDLFPGKSGSDPEDFAAMNGRVFFTASTAASGPGEDIEIFSSDGTAGGTQQITNFPNLIPIELTTVDLQNQGPTLFFDGDSSAGSELWKTDGTPGNASMVKDINPNGSSYPAFFQARNQELIFAAREPAHGEELWQSDGTSGGTQRITDIAPGAKSSWPEDILASGSGFYFDATATGNAHHSMLYFATPDNSGGWNVSEIGNNQTNGALPILVVNGDLFFLVNQYNSNQKYEVYEPGSGLFPVTNIAGANCRAIWFSFENRAAANNSGQYFVTVAGVAGYGPEPIIGTWS